MTICMLKLNKMNFAFIQANVFMNDRSYVTMVLNERTDLPIA